LAALNVMHLYPDGSAFYLRRRLAERHRVSPDDILVGNGSNEIIELVVRTFLRPRDEAVMADQAFVIYRMVVQAVAATPRVIPLRNFTHDLEAGRGVTHGRVRLPRQPEQLTDDLPRRGGKLPARPAARQLIGSPTTAYATTSRSSIPTPSAARRRLGFGGDAADTLEAYGLAGLRIGYAVAPGAVIEAMQRIRQPFNVNALALIGALAALDDQEHVRRTLEVNQQGMRMLSGAFDRLGLPFVPSAANFILVRVGQGWRSTMRCSVAG
jgi:histidinol-phosphate aminotransferase